MGERRVPSEASDQPLPEAPAGKTEPVRRQLGVIYCNESRRVFATLVRLLGDFGLAEEALHDAFRAALEQWPHEGMPANPRAWLVSTGRFQAIDALRRRTRFDFVEDLDDRPDPTSLDLAGGGADDDSVEDDRLRLIFTCCHPALSSEAQVALTLREVCGLTTEGWERAIQDGDIAGIAGHHADDVPMFDVPEPMQSFGREAYRQTWELFWLWEVRDMDEAVAWVQRCPNPMPGPSEIEIRPLYEAMDLR